MPVFNKAIEAAAHLVRNGEANEATEVIRKVLSGANGAKQSSDSTAPPSDIFSCFGPQADFSDFSKNLTVFTNSFWPGTAAATLDEPQTSLNDRFVARAYSDSCGTRSYKLFLPDHPAPPIALLVMLHGCSQNPDDFAAGTRMNEMAQRHNVIVAYPEQSRSANSSGCWNWFEPKDQHRGAGEPGILAGLTLSLAVEFGIGPGRIFAAGLSAGGAMAAILAKTYPDLFAAVGIHSGLPYGAAFDLSSAFSAMNNGASAMNNDAKGAGTAGPSLQDDLPVRSVPLIILHGDADRTVHPDNADGLVAQIAMPAAGLRTDVSRGTAAGGRTYVKTTGRDAKGAVRFENWSLSGAGHAWSGGSRAGSFTDSSGPDASAEMMRFFLQSRR